MPSDNYIAAIAALRLLSLDELHRLSVHDLRSVKAEVSKTEKTEKEGAAEAEKDLPVAGKTAGYVSESWRSGV